VGLAAVSAGPAGILETARLSLRHLDGHDAAFVLELVNDPGWLRFIGDRNIRDLDAARRYIAEGPVAMYRKFGFGLYLAELKSTATPIGLCGLVRRDGLDDVDIGFALLERFRGHGYAREAARAVLGHALGALGLRRVVAITAPDNRASQRILEDLGLSFERMIRLCDGAPEIMLYSPGPAAVDADGP